MDKTELKNIIYYLEKAIKYHNENSYEEFNNNFLEFETCITLGEGTDWLNFIYNFLDCWHDTFGHGWLYYEPLKKDDWVEIANKIIAAAALDKKFEPIHYKGKNLTTFFGGNE